MEFICCASKLLKGLSPALQIASKGVVKDWESAYRLSLKVKENEIITTAHGGRLAIELPVSDHNVDDLDYECITEGSATVNAVHFKDAVGSFRASDELRITGDSSEVKIALKNKDTEFQTVQVFDEVVTIPKLAKDFDKEIEISRDVFVKGKDKTFFAIGGDYNRELFLYWALRVDKDKARFISGNAARFAIIDFEGDSFLKSSGKAEFLFPKEQTDVIASILAEQNVDKVAIKQAKHNKDIPDQIIFDAGQIQIVLVAFDPSVRYVDENKVLDDTKCIHFTTTVDDWVYATKGMLATYTEEYKSQNDVFPAKLHVDLGKKQMVLKTDTPLKANREIPITSIISNSSDSDTLVLKCAGKYLSEIPTYSNKEAEVHFLADSPGKPVFIRHLEHDNQVQGIKESFMTFFALLDPDD